MNRCFAHTVVRISTPGVPSDPFLGCIRWFSPDLDSRIRSSVVRTFGFPYLSVTKSDRSDPMETVAHHPEFARLRGIALRRSGATHPRTVRDSQSHSVRAERRPHTSLLTETLIMLIIGLLAFVNRRSHLELGQRRPPLAPGGPRTCDVHTRAPISHPSAVRPNECPATQSFPRRALAEFGRMASWWRL